jgi:hypothetical protein
MNRVNTLLVAIVQLLDKHVVDMVKNSEDYFQFLYSYALTVGFKRIKNRNKFLVVNLLESQKKHLNVY